MQLSPAVMTMKEECARVRRDLHRIPETAFEEHETQAYVLDYLARCKPDVLSTLAGTGVKAVYYAKDAKETIAFRADMDGLPIEEWTELPFNPPTRARCTHAGMTDI